MKQSQDGGPPAQVMQAIAKLEQHLKDEPNDLQGWLLMAQTYTRMGRFDDSVEAYRHAVGISQGKEPGILSSYAEAMIAANQGMVPEEATRTFEAVLQSDPNDARARYYLALARGQAGDMRGALDRWVELAAQSPADAPWLPTVRQRITETAGQLGVDVASVMPQPLPATSAERSRRWRRSGSRPDARADGGCGRHDAGAAPGDDSRHGGQPRDQAPRQPQRCRRLAAPWPRLQGARRAGQIGRSPGIRRQSRPRPRRCADGLCRRPDGRQRPGGRPPASAIAVLRDVLALQPDNPQALWFLGLDAARTANTGEASQLWGKLLTQLQPGTPEHAEVQSRLDSLRQGG